MLYLIEPQTRFNQCNLDFQLRFVRLVFVYDQYFYKRGVFSLEKVFFFRHKISLEEEPFFDFVLVVSANNSVRRLCSLFYLFRVQPCLSG